MDNIDFNSNFIFGNLLDFVSFLAEILHKAISAKDITINVFEIILEAVGKRMGLSVNADQLKSLI